MPLARFALYESGVEIYVASTADDGDLWQATLDPHRAGVARVRRRAVPLPARPLLPRRLPAARGDCRDRDPRPRRLGDPRAGRLLPGRPALRRGGNPLRRPRARAARRGAAALRPRRPLPPAGRAPAPRHAVEPVTLVDAENVRRSQWPNIGREELVELVRRWAEATGAHALVVFDGDPPDVESDPDGEGGRHDEGERRRPDRPRRREARPAGTALPARHLGPRVARPRRRARRGSRRRRHVRPNAESLVATSGPSAPSSRAAPGRPA